MPNKVIRNNGEVIVDYIHEKNKHELRLKLLEFFVSEATDNVLLYMNTNSKKAKVPIEKIKESFTENNIDFLNEITENTGSGILRLGNFFRTRGNRKKIPEYIILATLNKDSALKDIYEKVLIHFDYAICTNPNKSMTELIAPIRNDVGDVLFNKEIFDCTCYDSIVVNQIRIDTPSESLNQFLDGLL